MGSPLFEKSDDMKQVVKELLEKRPELFEKVELSMIECAVRYDKEAPQSRKKVLDIKGVRNGYTVLTDKKYVISGYASQWNSLSPEKRQAHVANCLMSIKTPTQEDLNKCLEKGEDYEWGKINPPDLKNYKSFIEAFGVNWDADDANLPNISEDKKILF